MKYCEKCNIIVTLNYCPACGNKKIREITSGDFCFLVECGQMHGEMLKDALQEEKIKCVLLPWGDGVRSKLGLKLENYKVYVPYEHYERAREILAFYNEAESDDTKELLLANKNKWHIANERTEKKIRKRLKIDGAVDIFEYIMEGVEQSQDVKDRGFMSSFVPPAHGLTVKINNVTLWFSAETFEIIL